MQERNRTTILICLGLLFIALIGVWWYFGFSLGFMRFFAAEPVPPDTGIRGCVAPAGCTCRAVQCIQAPCDPEIVCPAATCRPYPPCLLPGANPACSVVEPPEGWCPPVTGMVQCAPATQTVRVGSTATLTAIGGSGPHEWFAPAGNPATAAGSTFTVTYDTAGTKKVTVQASRAAVVPTADSVACTVIVQPAASI